ncbi:MAG: HEAT repeat domain-containing protein [Acidobacteria bacterium]|nr:HEAT repeat domain-containing protein [Acidobacteriota bacterium]
MRAVLESADDPWDREDAVEALAESEQPDVAVPLLRMALTDRDEYVRLSAVEALATLGGDGAAEALELALRDEHSVIREEAIETL